MENWLKWKIRLIYLKLIEYKIIKEPPYNPNHGSYGSFHIWHPTTAICRMGHFWGDISKVTDESLLLQLIELLDKYKKEENWTDEYYENALKQNLMHNNVYELYQQTYLKRKERKMKLEKINKNE
jgi:hypothetical protein